LHLSGGAVKSVEILEGEVPFAESSRSTLQRWRFSEESAKSPVLVVVHFRQPDLHIVGSPTRMLSPSRAKQGLPYPKVVQEPVYPVNFVGRGSVALAVHLSADGSIEEIDVMGQSGPLVQASLQAVRSWQFAAAKDAQGKGVSSQLYAVCVYRDPVVIVK
jgi:hypothetical protein